MNDLRLVNDPNGRGSQEPEPRPARRLVHALKHRRDHRLPRDVSSTSLEKSTVTVVPMVGLSAATSEYPLPSGSTAGALALAR